MENDIHKDEVQRMFRFHRDKKNSSADDLASRMSEYLDCECIVVMPGENDGKLVEIYRKAAERRDVFPVFVRVDAALMESLLLNSDPCDSGEDGAEENIDDIPDVSFSDACFEQEVSEQDGEKRIPWQFSLRRIRAYREEKLSSDLPDGAEYFGAQRQKEARPEPEPRNVQRGEKPGRQTGRLHFLKSSLPDKTDADARSGSEPARGGRPELTLSDLKNLRSFWEFGTGLISETILALIPVSEPWRIFAWLPFGGWNRCPDAEVMMAVSKYWYEKYGAVPAAVSHDELEFLLPCPLDGQKAAEAVKEHILFCPDMTEPEGRLTESQLAEFLSRSKCWYFWWD